MKPQLQHVSDTALMVAACRALETRRPDGFIYDPLAERLAGERGMAIVQSAPERDWMCFAIGVRSRFVDELLLSAIERNEATTVANLGAGLDTRPWRLPLPSGVRWVEADFEPLLQYKAGLLAGDRPRCTVERVYADLTTEPGRTAVWSAIGSEPALMITEGLLMYLPANAVASLAQTADAQSGVKRWLLDIVSDRMRQIAHVDRLPELEKLRAPDHLAGQEILDMAAGSGWILAEKRRFVSDARKLAPERIAAMDAAAANVLRPPEDDPSGVYLLRR